MCDVEFLEPEHIQPGESAVQFSERIKEVIAKKARLTSVPFDGYLKYFQPNKRFKEHQQKVYSHSLKLRFNKAKAKERLRSRSPLESREFESSVTVSEVSLSEGEEEVG